MDGILLEKDQKAITIEYLPTEKELDARLPLEVGMGLTSNFNITEQLGSKDYFGTPRYLNNLDVVAVQYDQSLTEEEKQKKITKINEDIERLEKIFGKGMLASDNKNFWSKINLQLTKKTTNLDLNNPKNEILVNCIKAGGFKTVAPSKEEAENTGVRFYLIEAVEFVENRVSPRRLINDAIAELHKIDRSKSFDDLFFLAKYILPAEKSYTKRTPKSLMYEDLDKYINGEIIKDTKTKLATRFLDIIKKAKKDLIAYCLIKDAVYYSFLYVTPEGEFKNNETGGKYGTTTEKAAEHLLNPAYSNELDNVRARVEQKWSE